MKREEALSFVERHGVVLESGRGCVPNLAEAIVGHPIARSWWGHPEGRAIFRLTRAVRDEPDILVCRLVDGKITYVHRRLWPVLVRLADRLGKKRLAAIREEHTDSGAHRIREIPFPEWVPEAVRNAARALSVEDAVESLGRKIVGERGSHARAPRSGDGK